MFADLGYYQSKNIKGIHYIMVGMLFGFAFILRYQVAFAIAAIGLWQLVFKKMNFLDVFYMFLGFLMLVGIEVLIDYWYYGKWLFVPYNYFDLQLVQGISNNWGVFPWWHYGTLFVMHVSPPISIIFLVIFFIISIKEYKNIYVSIIWIFLLGHNLNGYKEIRYLYPLIPYFCVLICMFYDRYFDKIEVQKDKKYFKIIVVLVIIQNILLLTVCALKPAHEGVSFFSKIYSYSDKKINLYYVGENPYYWGTIKYDFYEPKSIQYIKIEEEEIKDLKPIKNEASLVFYKGFQLKNETEISNIMPIYKTIPMWLSNFNINNWMSRARIWSLYEIK